MILGGLLAVFRGFLDWETKPAKTRNMTWEERNGPNENSGTGVGLCCLVVQGQTELLFSTKQTVKLLETFPNYLDVSEIHLKPA